MLDADDDDGIVSLCIVARWRRRSCLRVKCPPQVLHPNSFGSSLLCVLTWVLRLCLRAEASKRNELIIKLLASDSQNRHSGHLNGLTGPCASCVPSWTTLTAAERETVADSCTATALAVLGGGMDSGELKDAAEYTDACVLYSPSFTEP